MRRIMLVLVTILAFGAWRMAGSAEEPLLLPVDPVPLVIETQDGPVEFSIEIADDPDERERGLMFRQQLDANHGMLFVFDRTGRQSFWMRNTPVPLDLLFISENGRIVAIQPGEPFSLAPISPLNPVRFVLELHRGTAIDKGIAVGLRVRHPALNLR